MTVQNLATMFYSTNILCLLLVVFCVTDESDAVDNWFQIMKEAGKKIAGGDGTPWVDAMNKAEEFSNFNEYQEKFHEAIDMFMAAGMDEESQKMVNEESAKFSAMVKDGASEADCMKQAAKVKEAMEQAMQKAMQSASK